MVSFSWCVKLNLGFGYYACHGALTHPEPVFHKFYDFTPSLTSRDNGQLGERAAGALSPPGLSFPSLLFSLKHKLGGCLALLWPYPSICIPLPVECREEWGLVTQTSLWVGEGWERPGPGRSLSEPLHQDLYTYLIVPQEGRPAVEAGRKPTPADRA